MEQQICDIIQTHLPEVIAIYLYGSYAKGTARPDSDVDVAIYLPNYRHHGLSDIGLWRVRQALMVGLNRDVDLVLLNEDKIVLNFEVVSYGKVLFCRDEAALLQFKLKTLSFYCDFEVATQKFRYLLFEPIQ